jgi:hypothetical protein
MGLAMKKSRCRPHLEGTLSMQTICLERLEDRLAPSVGPVTPWHYANGGNFAFGSYNAPGDPGSVGFNLVDINSPDTLSHIPAGCKALVMVGKTNGVDADFINTIRPYLGNPKVFGFYLADEPNPATVPASNLMAESDWIHAHFPGAKTFMVLSTPYQGYTPSNTHIDLVGLDPYPIRTGGVNYNYIPEAVNAATAQGWSQGQILPVYQAFGGTGSFAVPTAEQERQILAIWANLTPNPAFDYAFSWGAAWGSQSLASLPDLQSVFLDHNTNATSASSAPAGSSGPPNPFDVMAQDALFVVQGWLAGNLNLILHGLLEAQSVLLSNRALAPQLQQAFFMDLFTDVSAVIRRV